MRGGIWASEKEMRVERHTRDVGGGEKSRFSLQEEKNRIGKGNEEVL